MAAQWPLPEDHRPGDPNFTGGINQLSANLNAMHDDADGAANQAIAAAATATAAAQTAHDISGIATTDDAVSTLLTNPTAGPKTVAGLDARIAGSAGVPRSVDGTHDLPVPTGTGLEFIIGADGLDDIRFNGVSL